MGTSFVPLVSGEVVGGAVENLGGTVARLLRASAPVASADAEPEIPSGGDEGDGPRCRAKPGGTVETSALFAESPASWGLNSCGDAGACGTFGGGGSEMGLRRGGRGVS